MASYLPKIEEGEKLVGLVKDSYRWYRQNEIGSSGISNILSSDLSADEHRIARIGENGDLSLLGAYILGFGVRERFISKELLENLESNTRYLSPLMLARALEIEPASLLEYKRTIETQGRKPKLIHQVSLPDDTIDYFINVEDMAGLTVPPVDMQNLNSLSEQDVIRRYKLSGNPQYKEMVCRNFFKMIYSVLNNEFPVAKDIVGEKELFSMGLLGLVKAIDSYDLTKGTRFNTYAYVRIKGTIIDGLREINVTTRAVLEAVRILEPYIEKADVDMEGRPSVDSLAEKTGLNPEMIKRALEVMPYIGYEVVSLDEPNKQLDEGTNLYDIIPSEEFGAPDTEVAGSKEERLSDIVNRALALLPPKEKELIVAHYYQGITLQELGDRNGVSESRICQIIADIEAKLSKIIDPSQIEF